MKKALVKICGMTRPEDVLAAAEEGVDMIGIILWEHSRRFVTLKQAKEISTEARLAGIIPVIVFVDHGLEQIHEYCHYLKIATIQLHGEKTHLQKLVKDYTCISSVKVSPLGKIEEDSLESADYLLFDNGSGGTGTCFCWDHFTPPQNHPWFLAGGITPENVGKALALNPTGIDVASGVEIPGTTMKDRQLIKSLMAKVKNREKK